MKIKKYFYITILLVASMAISTSCSNDWITTNPTGETSDVLIYSTTENLYIAVNGLGKLTTMQYLSSQGFNGEGTVKLYYGEYPGNNFVRDLSGWASIINFNYYANTTSIYCYYPWYYYYRIIGDSNAILGNVDAAQGTDEDKMEIKARALCYRAHSYLMLSQLYSTRWSDSNGTQQALPIKLSLEDDDNTPLSTLAEVYIQIYQDLDNAIEFFTNSGKGSKIFNDMTLNAAYAIYARAAITREDFDTAATMAEKARTGHTLMTNNELLSGFCNDNSEWIWGSAGVESENLYYYSYQAQMAYNANTSLVRSYPTCITRELFNKIPESDTRRSWWYAPNANDAIPEAVTNEETIAAIKEQAAYGSDFTSTHKFYNYMQLKIAARSQPGIGDVPHYRTAEMYLIEAEALARKASPDYSGAQKTLTELNVARDASFSTTKTGDDLIEEIWMYRSIELWGEGFDWFDVKRTGRSIERTEKSNIGSFLSVLAVSYGPSERNNWTWEIPNYEVDYNTALE